MRLCHGERARAHGESVVASSAVAVVVAQPLRLAKRLNVVVQESKKLIVPNILDALGNFLDPSPEPNVVHVE